MTAPEQNNILQQAVADLERFHFYAGSAQKQFSERKIHQPLHAILKWPSTLTPQPFSIFQIHIWDQSFSYNTLLLGHKFISLRVSFIRSLLHKLQYTFNIVTSKFIIESTLLVQRELRMKNGNFPIETSYQRKKLISFIVGVLVGFCRNPPGFLIFLLSFRRLAELCCHSAGRFIKIAGPIYSIIIWLNTACSLLHDLSIVWDIIIIVEPIKFSVFLSYYLPAS